jgi:hypothetical protein
MSRRLAALVALLFLAQSPALVIGQTQSDSGAGAKPAHSDTSTPGGDANSGQDAGGGANQAPQIIVNPPAAPAPEWSWHDRVAWGSGIILAALGYAGIMLALRTLRSIDRHLEAGVSTAHAAMESANAALALSQAIANSERPWIVVTVEPFLTMESSFKVMAANRGRSPARIIASVDQVKIVQDETKLPKSPEFDTTDTTDEFEPIVLLPGEATGIWAFNREDLPAICKSAEVLKRVEHWQETLFLYGRITYMDLNFPADKQTHETFWCCRYIHGEKSSALAMAGRPEYNQHS